LLTTRAEREILDFLRVVQGDRVGLVAFAGIAFVQCPLTLDYEALKIFLNELKPDLIPVPGTDLGAAIQAGLAAFDFTSATDKVILLITDGEDNEKQGLAAARKALTWIRHQSPDDQVMVGQLPTTDWRDEQVVFGFGLYVNALVYIALRLFEREEEASQLRELMNRLNVRGDRKNPHVHEGLVLPHKPYYALYSYKVYHNERFDLLGNSLAILAGIASPTRRRNMIAWIETESCHLRENGRLAVDVPPCLFPYIQPEDPDWWPRYARYNPPGCYHNGGVWPFVCGFYVAACVAAGRTRLAREKLAALTALVRPSNGRELAWGFNEWIRAQTGTAAGRNWQTWSAAMYLYAVECVKTGRTPFFDDVRTE